MGHAPGSAAGPDIPRAALWPGDVVLVYGEGGVCEGRARLVRLRWVEGGGDGRTSRQVWQVRFVGGPLASYVCERAVRAGDRVALPRR